LLLLLFLSFLYWNRPHLHHEETPTEDSLLSNSQANSQANPQAISQAISQVEKGAQNPDQPKATSISSKPIAKQIVPAENPDGAPPDPHWVAFRVVNGLAIAYGDILLGKPQEGMKQDHGFFEPPRPQIWEKPEIPYAISPELPNPKRVEKAVEYFNQHTPVSFVPYQDQRDGVIFEKGGEHCVSYLGKIGGLQPIRLDEDCQPTQIMHEMMHALSFIHEQSRTDRDQYIEILWQNIEEKYKSEFAVVPDSFMDPVREFNFDYHSIMLYDPRAFALRPNLLTLKSIGSEMISPVKDSLSGGDLGRLRRLYHLD